MRVLILVLMGFILCTGTAYGDHDVESPLPSIPFHPEFVKPQVTLTPEETTYYQQITDILKHSSYGAELLQIGEQMHFQFGGFLSTSNDAITIPSQRMIQMSADFPMKKGAITLAYELVNVKNIPRYNEVIRQGKQREITQREYAWKMIRLEAEAGYGRSVVAKELGVYYLDPFHPLFNSMGDEIAFDQKIDCFAKHILAIGSVVGQKRVESAEEYYRKQYDGFSTT